MLIDERDMFLLLKVVATYKTTLINYGSTAFFHPTLFLTSSPLCLIKCQFKYHSEANTLNKIKFVLPELAFL